MKILACKGFVLNGLDFDNNPAITLQTDHICEYTEELDSNGIVVIDCTSSSSNSLHFCRTIMSMKGNFFQCLETILLFFYFMTWFNVTSSFPVAWVEICACHSQGRVCSFAMICRIATRFSLFCYDEARRASFLFFLLSF